MSGNVTLRAGYGRAYPIGAIVFGLLTAAATVAQMVLLGEVVDRVLLSEGDLESVGRLFILLLGAVVARSGFAWLREVVALRGAVRAKREIRERLLDHLFALGPAHSSGRTGELVTTAVKGVEQLEAYFARYLPQVYLSALVPLLIAVCVLLLDPLSGIVLLATGPAIPVLMVLIGRHAEERTRQQWSALSRMGAHFLDALRGLPTLKTFGRAEAERERVARISAEFGRRTMEVLRVAFVSGFVLEFIATVSVALVAVLLAVRLLFGDLSFGIALPALLLAPEFYRPLRELGASRHAGLEGKAVAESIDEILETPVSARETQGFLHPPAGPVTVELANVSFAYLGSARPTLSGVDLVLQAGTRTALIGPSGAGKSTLVDLLLRLADPHAGRILANGVPVEDIAAENWRERVAVVPQRPHLFYGSVLENLRLARPEASREQVEEAAELAGAHGFVRRLPRGYDTHIGEGGARLSAGEIRRLAVARAFLKDAPLLVMDEPTSDLDPESERLIEDALESLGPDRTVLTIAHRLGVARSADRIAVLESGRLAELGIHEELAESDGPYARLLDAAARGQRDRRWEQPASEAPVSQRSSSPEQESRAPARQDEGSDTGSFGVQARARGRTLMRLLGFSSSQRGRIALGAALATWTVGANVGLLAVSAYLVSASALKPPLAALIPAAVLVQVLGTSRGVSRYFDRLVSHAATFELLATLRAWLYGRLAPLSPARLVQRRGGDLLSRMVDDVEELQNVYLRVVSPVVVAAVVPAVVVAVLSFFDSSLALATLLFLGCAGVGAPLLAGALERAPGRRWAGLRAALAAELAESARGMRDLLVFGRAREKRREIDDLVRRLAGEQRRAAFATGLREGLHDLAAGLAAWTVLLLAVPLAEEGRIGGVYLALVVMAALASFEAVRPLGEAIQTLDRSVAAGERVFEISDSEPAVGDPETPLRSPTGRALEFDRVTFRYESDEPPVLEEVSFSLQPGAKVAVVGPSGSGKSTLVNLLLRFWDPTRGGVRLDGEDLRAYAQEDVRSAFSVAAQDAHVFDATLRENLLLARPGATEEELRSALKKAQLECFVKELPRGVDTLVGELGSRLSGGERQRLAVARAFLKDAPFLVLDEPTADLDAETEGRLMDAAHEFAERRGLLLITHRLVGMERMNDILVLDGGRIVERGTHEELLRAGGAYRRMVEAQERMLVER